MAYIKVDINKLDHLESQLSKIPSVIGTTASIVRSVRSGLDWDVACEANIDSTLRRIASDLENCKSRMQKTVSFVDSAVQQYDKVENAGKGYSSGGGGNGSFGGGAGGGGFRSSAVLSRIDPYFFHFVNDVFVDGVGSALLTRLYPGPISSAIVGASLEIIKGIKTGATVVKGTISNCVSAIKADFEAKGTSYRIVKGLGAVADIAVGTASLVCAIAGTGITAGLGAPATVLIGAYGGNQAISGITDLYNCITGNVDAVGEVNLLKSCSTGICGQVGEWLGDRDIGESVGEAIYTIGGLTSTVVSLTNLAGQIRQANSAGKTLNDSIKATKTLLSEARKELPHAIDGVGYIAINSSDLSSIPYQLSMLSKELPNIGSAISDFNLITKGVDESKKVIDAGIKVVNTLAGWEMLTRPTFITSIEKFNSTMDSINFYNQVEKIDGSVEKIDDVLAIELLGLFEPMPAWDI